MGCTGVKSFARAFQGFVRCTPVGPRAEARHARAREGAEQVASVQWPTWHDPTRGGGRQITCGSRSRRLSLQRENLVEVQQGQDGHVESNRADKHTATHQRFLNRDSGGNEQLMLVYKVCAPKGFQRQSTLEKGMRDWFDKGEATTNKFVLCAPGGIGKSTLVYILCVCIHMYKYAMCAYKY